MLVSSEKVYVYVYVYVCVSTTYVWVRGSCIYLHALQRVGGMCVLACGFVCVRDGCEFVCVSDVCVCVWQL